MTTCDSVLGVQEFLAISPSGSFTEVPGHLACGRYLITRISVETNPNGALQVSNYIQEMVDHDALEAANLHVARLLKNGERQNQAERSKVTPPPF